MKAGITIYGAHLLVPEENRTVANIIRAAAHLGFDGIDLGYYWGENKTAEFEEARKVADGEGIAIANYIVGNNFGNAAAEDRLDAEIEKVKVALAEAAMFNCSALRVFAGGYDLNWDEYSPRIADALAACVETAQKNNAKIQRNSFFTSTRSTPRICRPRQISATTGIPAVNGRKTA